MTDFPTSPETATLKPCPFCGGRANLYTNEVDFIKKWSVGCGDCNANMDVCEDTQAEAAEVWNCRFGFAQRPADSALRELVEFWIYDGRLQTFEDRERFRKAARAALADTSKNCCICQDQHRRGYCTEPGCPYNIDRPAVSISSPERGGK